MKLHHCILVLRDSWMVVKVLVFPTDGTGFQGLPGMVDEGVHP